VRLPKIFGTSSFRLALFYAGITGISFFLLFVLIFWSTARFMRHQIDDQVSNELNEVIADSQSGAAGAIQALVTGMVRHPSGFFYLLQDPQGAVLAGNLPSTDPRPGIREWGASPPREAARYAGIRGRGMEVGGDYLFVGWSTHQLNEMEEFIAESFLGGLIASIVLALTVGVVTSRRLLRKIENVSETSRNIVKGDLKQRVHLRHSGDEFDHLALSINAMLDRIEALMGEVRQVTTDIAHDLRTPLTRLRNRLELAQRTNADAPGLRDTIAHARRETDVILEIFGALLRIAQVESGARKSAFARVNVTDIINTVLEVYRPSVEEKRQSLRESVEPGLSLTGDRELLTQMFANLLENATLHAPPGAVVSVTAHGGMDCVEVTISDDGPGIPAAMRDKVLGRFFRLEQSRTTPGSGLGLSLASAIAQLHDAELMLTDNSPGLMVRVSFTEFSAQND
jgi:signal transduction histidine kinase